MAKHVKGAECRAWFCCMAQAPPNLTPAAEGADGELEGSWRALLDAGINDFGASHSGVWLPGACVR